MPARTRRVFGCAVLFAVLLASREQAFQSVQSQRGRLTALQAADEEPGYEDVPPPRQRGERIQAGMRSKLMEEAKSLGDEETPISAGFGNPYLLAIVAILILGVASYFQLGLDKVASVKPTDVGDKLAPSWNLKSDREHEPMSALRLLARCQPRLAGGWSTCGSCGFRSKATMAAQEAAESKWSYVAFAKAYPSANNLIIATVKTSAADLVAQCVIERKSITEVDWKRNLVFCLFGAAYLGAFQYWYQVNVFKRMFTGVEKFTTQPWAAKLRDGPGLMALGAQTALDLGMLTCVYLPTFYVFKASVFSNTWDASAWVSNGIGNYTKNWNKDVYDVFRVWGPADLVCFSVPLWLRLPVRHIVSFVWTAYLSFARGANK